MHRGRNSHIRGYRQESVEPSDYSDAEASDIDQDNPQNDHNHRKTLSRHRHFQYDHNVLHDFDSHQRWHHYFYLY